MVNVWASEAFNQEKLDLFGFLVGFIRSDVTEIQHNSPITIRGVTYKTYFDMPYAGEHVIAAGDNLRFIDSNDAPLTVTGTIRALTGPVSADGSNAGSGLAGLSIPLSSLIYMQTQAEGQAIIRGQLAGADTFKLSASADMARGYAGNDVMEGKGGADRLFGDGGDDRLFGGAGSDQLTAGSGHDLLVGGTGVDVLSGGTDSLGDVFDFNARADSGTGANSDMILNFSTGSDDIDLRGLDAKAGTTGVNDAFAWGGQTAVRNGVWWDKVGPTGAIVHADVNGDARSDFDLFVDGSGTLARGDFLL